MNMATPSADHVAVGEKPDSGGGVRRLGFSRADAWTPCEEPPLLEEWYRRHLGRARYDISSSGVSAYGFAELRALCGLSVEALDATSLDDSVSYGAPALRRALADRYAEGDVARVMATHGSSEAIALVLGALLEPGDRVLVNDPAYHSLRSVAERRGCRVVGIPIPALQGDQDGILDAALLSGARALVVNFPHNPTGASISDRRLDELIEKCWASGCTLVWDAAMAELPMTGDRLRRTAPGDAVVFGTLSKAFGLPGLRVGWCVAAPELLSRTLPVRDRTTLFLSPLVELIATCAVESADRLIEPRLETARANLATLDAWIESHSQWVRWTRPEGGVCGLMEVKGETDIEGFCLKLLDRTGVILVPGTAFDRPGAVRIGYGGRTGELREGLSRLSEFLRARR